MRWHIGRCKGKRVEEMYICEYDGAGADMMMAHEQMKRHIGR